MDNNQEVHQAISYGIISITITTVGIILGFLHSKEATYKIILTTIISAVLSDSIADGYSMYFSNKAVYHDHTQAIKGGFVTFLIKLLVGSSFAIPFILFDNLKHSIYTSVVWSFILLFCDSLYIAHLQQHSPTQTKKEITTQMSLGVIVMVIILFVSHLFGKW